ncbi:MAG: molybdenum cofactor guanylyltransferase [Planctomycetes bacterium]|nr:molybdenum cofactor guanylyltransferase [Planctomycetota bacterium]
MGYSTAMLPFGPERMLQRVVRLVGEAVPRENIVVVAAEGQELPPLPDEITVTHDRQANRGPLEGLACGFAALAEKADAAYATSCDVPLIVPAFIQRMFELLTGHDIAVPKEEKFHHPLAAVYCTSVLPQVEELLAADRLRPVFLFEQCKTREVAVDELQAVDPQLMSLRNVNQPADYASALQEAGFELPDDIRSALER